MPARCEQCGSEEYMPYVCKFCQGKYCAAHRLPENHTCAGLEAYRQKAREEGRLVRPTPDVMAPKVSAGARASMSMDALWSKVQGKMTYVFIGISLVMYLLEVVLIRTAPAVFDDLFVIQRDFVVQPWTILTSMFSHSPVGISHLLFNMLFLYFFGTTVERLIGTRRFTWLFLGAGALAGVLQVLVFGGSALGASGALQGVAGTLVLLAPRLTVYVMGIIPAPMWAFGLFFVFIDTVGLINPTGNVAHLAHLAGFAVGAAYGYRLKQHGMRVHNPRPTIRRNF